MTIAQRMDSFVAAPRWALPLRDFYIGFGWVGALSSALALAQWAFGWFPFLVWSKGPDLPGLFYNPVHAGATLAIIALALYIHRAYWLIPALLPGIILSNSRGAWLALGFGLIATRLRYPLFLLILVLSAGVMYTSAPGASDSQRLQIWHAAVTHLTFWGNGIGSFMDLYIRTGNVIYRPEYVHNDYLQTIFELGVWSIIPFAAIAWAASRTAARDWPLLATFLFLACFSMPIHMPLVAAIGVISFFSVLGAQDA